VDYVVSLHTVDSDVIARDSHPATGNLLAMDWQAGQTWAERYIVQIPLDAPAQTVFQLVVGLFDREAQSGPAAYDADGNALTPLIGRIAIHGIPEQVQIDYRLGDSIGLRQPDVNRTENRLQVCLMWTVLDMISADYQIFVHLLDENNSLLDQADHQPRAGRYPTAAWNPGEAIFECVQLNSAAGTGERVAVGMYSLNDGIRLPMMREGSSALLPDGAIILTVP